MNGNMFQERLLCTDVLSVASYLKYILAGIGHSLYIYNNEELQLKIKIFNGERIHSIHVYDSILLIKGCKELTLMTLDNGCEEYHILHHINCRDWIQDVFYDLKKKVLILATAHNVIEVWDIKSKSCLESYVCEEKCILYSCKFINTNAKDFVLLCGTVFSEIVVWAPFLPPTKDQPVLNRLKGHNGVIFSLAFDPQEKIICSTSDDRSLRVWHVDSAGPIFQRKTWKKTEITLIHTLYGHTARVWTSLVLSERIVSAGEDSKICIWNKNGILENCLDLHQESGIRGLCHLEDTDYIVSGGEDGGITLLSPQRYYSLSSPKRDSYDLGERVFGLPRKVAYIEGNVMCTTDRGCILFAEGHSLTNVVYEDKDFSNYCLLEVSHCETFLLLASIKGRIVIIEAKTKTVCFSEEIIDGKIFSVHWLTDHIVICTSNGIIITHKVNLSPVLSLDKEKVFSLPKAKERWTTCALIHRNHLIVGDRMGSIHVYSLSSVQESPQRTFPKIHGHLGVTDIIQDGDVVLTSGRDRSVKQFYMSDEGVMYSLKYKLPMEWPWRMVKCPQDRLVLGFSSVYFVIWSLGKREVLAKFDCGGGHRSCDFVITNDICRLLYIKDKRVHTAEFPLCHTFPIRTGFHGKEINCLKILQKNPLVVVTGSEDTTLRISGVKNNKLNKIYVIENHISSVRDLTVLAVSEHDRILFSAGGRAQISVHTCNTDNWKYGELEVFFLQEPNTKEAKPAFEGETRIMCLDSTAYRGGVLLSAGCSDRKIRVFSYQNRLNIVTSIPYSHCILKVCFVQLDSLLILLTTATDGCVVFWDVTDIVRNPNSFRKIDSIRIHQSGINGFEVKNLREGKFLLATGGDDNLLSVLLFRLDVVQGVKILQEWRNSSAHSGQITGITSIGNALLTASVDQRLTVWRCAVDGNTFQVVFVDQYISPVADVQGIQAVLCGDSTGLVCLHGKGIEIIDIDVTLSSDWYVEGLDNQTKTEEMITNDPFNFFEMTTFERITGQLECGEGPHWDSSRKCLYLVDINRSLVLRYVPATKQVFQAKVDGPSVSLIIPVKDTKDKFLIGVGRCLAIMTWDGVKNTITKSDLEVVCTVEEDKSNNRFNDGKTDAMGRVFAGTMGAFVNGAWEMKRGSLYSVAKDRVPKIIARDIGIANGLAWSPDYKTFYYIDSLAYRIDVFDYNLQTGDATNRRVLFDLKSNGIDGLPDGMCVDTNGNLWVALYEGGLMCLNPGTRQVLLKMPLPGCHITSVAFGGENLDELYVTSAAQHMTSEERKTNPLFGCTFKITGLGVKGFDGIPVVL